MQKQKKQKFYLILILIIWWTNNFFAQHDKKIINPSWIDSDYSLQKDFYLHANGNWLKNEKIPNAKNRWGNLDELQEKNHHKLIQLLQKIEKKTQNKEEEVIKNFILSFQNSNQRVKNKRKFIEEGIETIQSIQTKNQLMKAVAKLHQEGIPAIFNLKIQPDIHDRNKTRLFLEEKKITQNENLQEIYKSFDFSNDQSIIHYQNTLEIEHRITNKKNKKNIQNSLNEEYNRLSINELEFRFKELEINHYFQSLNLPKVDFVILKSPQYFYLLSELFQEIPLETWKSYLLSHLILHYDYYINTKSIETKSNHVYNECLELINLLPIREILEKKYMQEYYNLKTHNKVLDMTKLLKQTFKERLIENKWLEPKTKKIALEKLDSMIFRIGTPEKWNDFGNIQLSESNLIQNIKNCKIWEFEQKRRSLTDNQIIVPWENPVYSIDAFYNQVMNIVTIPAGLLQDPFFNIENDDVINFAALGSLIGHEMIHGFDIWGAKFNSKREFLNWWTKIDKDNFEALSEKIKKNYATFCTSTNICTQPQNTIAEDLADLGGITIAFFAYKKSTSYCKQKPTKQQALNRLFFINFAQMHACNYTEQEIKNRIKNDVHSLAQYRVNGVLMNLKEFHDAFNIYENDPIHWKEIIEIW